MARVLHVSVWGHVIPQFRLPLLVRQRERHERVAVYCPDDPAHVRLLREAGLEVEVARLSVRPGPTLPLQVLALERYLAREGFDVLFAHQPMGLLIAVPAALVAGVPVRIYATGGLRYVPERSDPWNRAMWAVERRLIDRVDAVLLVNREDEELLRGIPGVGEKAVHVGPRGGCGIDTRRWDPARRRELRQEARASLGLEPGAFVVGFSGRCVWEKGFRELVAAARGLARDGAETPVRFLVVGSGRDLGAIRRHVEGAGLGGRFTFLGYRFDPDWCLAALDLFVLPSYREGMPVALLEAMAYGLPCVATRVRGSREVVRDGETGLLVPPRDAARLEGAIRSVLASPDRGEAMGTRASREVAERYREEVLLERTERLLDAIVERKLGGR